MLVSAKNRFDFLFVYFSAVILLLIAVAPAGGAAAVESRVEEIDRLVDGGALTLALRVIDGVQPSVSASPVRWQRFERRRLAILESRRAWSSVIDRVGAHPPSLPDDFWIEAREALARAFLAIGDARAAGAVVAGLVWSTAQDTAMVHERSERLSRWRGMLAESYLLAGQLADAETAVVRYRLDYGGEPDGWRLSHAKALIRAGANDEARELLAGVENTEVLYLRLLLDARDPDVDPVELLADMGPLLGEGRLVPAERAQLWAALAVAAARYRDHDVRVTAMEQAVSLNAPVEARNRLVRVDADALWAAYESHAAALANEARLLVGRFESWLALAGQSGDVSDVGSRSLYAYLAGQDRDARIGGAARAGLVSALDGQARGLRILGALYLDSRRYPDIDAIPTELRAPLIAYALAESRIGVRAALLTGLDVETRQALPVRWRAPVAVALIGTGRIDEALSLFGDDLDIGQSAPSLAVDALVRVALALQSANQHVHAAALLSRALVLAHEAWERRELLLLAAESETHAGRHERAARLYIESAAVPDGGVADDWSRAASVQAARALARAGLDADAVGVLQSALADSRQPDERLFVEHVLRRY